MRVKGVVAAAAEAELSRLYTIYSTIREVVLEAERESFLKASSHATTLSPVRLVPPPDE